MSSSFDATARINLDLSSFARGAQAITKSGGQMESIFRNLNQVLGKVALVEKDLAAKLRTSLTVYNQISTAAKNYASAVAQLQKGEQSGANGAKLMTQAFAQLKSALAGVQGLSEKEFQRISRTVQLYERLANVIKTLSAAQKNMASVTQGAINAEQKDEQAKRKSEETDRRLSLEEAKLALQREKLAIAAQRAAQDEQRMAAARSKLDQSTRNASNSNVSFSASSFAVRNSLGELEQSFQSLFKVVSQLPLAFAKAAISQEAAFAQTTRVVGDADAAAAGLLQRFQEIAQQAPISFEEVARIGQLGAQIGISASELGDFTNTIVEFSLTTGVASDEVTLLLGRIAQMENVPISQMEQLGSAILALGTASVATDEEILRVNASIATASNLFGLTAQETAGLSAALASLQVRPELARGSLTRVFNELTTAVSDGGTELHKLATVMGITDEEVTKLFNNPATRGDFLLQFIKGLSGAATAGGDVQGVLRELGVGAVRDIDVFSRLANNFGIVSDSFDKANIEFARGTELGRQARGIYETTAAEIQNLGDAFNTLLASLGGPLATAIGAIASGLGNVIEGIAHLGPIVPVFGTLAAVVATGGAAWLIYQVALAKTIQGLIATKELQNSLKVSSLSLKTAIDVYRGSLEGASAAQAVTNGTTRELNVSSAALAISLGRSEVGMRAYAAAAASSAAGLDLMSASNVAASRSMQNINQITGITIGQFTALNRAGAASALAMLNVSNANRSLALTQTQLASSSTVSAEQMTISASAISGLNTSAVRSIPALTSMSGAMQRAAVSGAALGAGLRGTVNVGTTAATAFTRVGTAAQSASLGARAASFAFGPWGIALSTIGILLAPMLSNLADFSTESDKIAKSAMEATGGTTALANAIEADTTAAANGVKPFRELKLAKDDIAKTDQQSAERARTEAQERARAIELTKGSVEQLKAQAAGHGEGAKAARTYLREIDAANDTVRKSTEALSENTAAIGQNVKQWLVDTAQAVVEQSKLADGSKISSDALDQLAKSGINVGDVLQTSLSDPQKALKTLDGALKTVKKTADNYAPAGTGTTDFGKQINDEAAAAIRLKNFLEALRKVVASQDSGATKAALTSKLLKDALDGTADSAGSATGNIKLTRESLEDLDSTAEDVQKSIDELGTTFEKFGTPLTAFQAAAKTAFGTAEDAVTKFSLHSKGGLESYIKELEKIAKAQRDWSANLIKISATLGPDIAEQFRKLGPEAAPAVAELANLSVAELAKIGPRLAQVGADATSDLAAAIIQNSGKIENATLQTRKIISDVFGNIIDKAKTSEDFADVSNQYALLVKQLTKSKVTIDISANDAKAFKTLNDISLFIDLVGKKKIAPEVAISIVKAQGDLGKLQAAIAAAEKSGSLDPKGKATLETFLFQQQLTKLTGDIDTLEEGSQLDPLGHAEMDDKEYRAKVLKLTEFLASAEGQGLLNPNGTAQLHDKAYRAQIEALAKLILGDEAANKFDVNGDGKLNDGEFKKLLEALKRAVADANRGKLDPHGRVTLANTGNFNAQLGNAVQAAQRAGTRISNALSRSATVSVGYFYYQKNSPPKTLAAATGGWINGPGGPTSDSIPAMLSNGEFVVNAAAARRFGALLEVINRSGGRGFSGMAKRLLDSASATKQVKLSTNTGNSLLNSGMVQQSAPESVSVSVAHFVPGTGSGPTNVFNISNQYPQAEPTSMTVNRSLAYAATISGV